MKKSKKNNTSKQIAQLKSINKLTIYKKWQAFVKISFSFLF